MIYFTTFILAFFLSQIARAEPQACGDVIPPESPTPVEQFNIPLAASTVVAYNHKYDNPYASTNSVACYNLALQHPEFHNFPYFPRIGGAFDIGLSPGPNCGKCWKLTYLERGRSIVITAIDHAVHGFVLSEAAFMQLKGGPLGPPLENVQYLNVPRDDCGL
jgi:Cerato-platanin